MTNPYYLGIDTGGTFTDGILFDPQTRQVVRSAKVHTTHADLSQCIANVLQELIVDPLPEIAFVSLSTTLATNAIAEGKRRPVALLLLGYDPELVYTFKFHQEFGTRQFFFIDGRHDLSGKEQSPLDLSQVTRAYEQSKDLVEAFAVCSYAGPVNAAHEECASEALSGLGHLPVVQAHHLSDELDSIRRAITASLNASLLSNTQTFIEAVQAMLRQRGILSPILIVKGDGSVAQAEYARQRPVEIVHSGPATSAIGGQYLAGVDSALVIDMGGTTTDLVLIDGGKFQAYEQAASVGPFRTCVRTIKSRSTGLGGDSLIRFDHWRNLEVGPQRAVPLAYLCHAYPEVQRDLAGLLQGNGLLRYSDQLEYWIFQRQPPRPIQDEKVRRALDVLRGGPMRLGSLMKLVGVKSPVLLDRDELLRTEVIQRAGLTPTDLLHASGEYAPWDAASASLAASAAAHLWDEGAAAFTERVKETIARQIVAEIVQLISGRALSEPNPANGLDHWLFDENFTGAHPYLGCQLHLKMPIVGIGAPAKAFLPRVAQALGTEIIFPEHYEVANAVGTVVGNVMVQKAGQVFPSVEGTLITGYFARLGSHQIKLATYNEALAYAQEELIRQARAQSEASGAAAPLIDCQVHTQWDGMAEVVVTAVGKPGTGG